MAGRKVWVTRGGRHTHIHDRPDCRGFATAKKRAGEVTQVPLAQVRYPVPCRWCWPTSPRLRVWHPVCMECGHTKPVPCPHNGAVRVYQVRRGQWTGQVGASEFDPDAVVYQERWVWPENAHRYTLVSPVQSE